MNTPQLTAPHEQIAERAEALWQQAGCPVGCDLDFWLRAENALILEYTQTHWVRCGLSRAACAEPPSSGVDAASPQFAG